MVQVMRMQVRLLLKMRLTVILTANQVTNLKITGTERLMLRATPRAILRQNQGMNPKILGTETLILSVRLRVILKATVWASQRLMVQEMVTVMAAQATASLMVRPMVRLMAHAMVQAILLLARAKDSAVEGDHRLALSLRRVQ
jgi:hypothetical protein